MSLPNRSNFKLRLINLPITAILLNPRTLTNARTIRIPGDHVKKTSVTIDRADDSRRVRATSHLPSKKPEGRARKAETANTSEVVRTSTVNTNKT